MIKIIGAGGLGGYVCEFLARMGARDFVIYDDDKFCDSNLNRQIGALKDTIGEYKAKVISERNVNVYGNAIKYKLIKINENNINTEILKGDIIFDCSDNISARQTLAKHLGVVDYILIHGAVSDKMGHIAVFNESSDFFGDMYACKCNRKIDTISFAPPIIAGYMVSQYEKLLNNKPLEYNKLLIIDIDTAENTKLSF